MASEQLIQKSLQTRVKERVLRQCYVCIRKYDWVSRETSYCFVKIAGYEIEAAGRFWFVHNLHYAVNDPMALVARTAWGCTDPYTGQQVFTMQHPPGTLTKFIRELDAFLTPEKLKIIESARKRVLAGKTKFPIPPDRESFWQDIEQ
jgi:hypothetical protein